MTTYECKCLQNKRNPNRQGWRYYERSGKWYLLTYHNGNQYTKIGYHKPDACGGCGQDLTRPPEEATP